MIIYLRNTKINNLFTALRDVNIYYLLSSFTGSDGMYMVFLSTSKGPFVYFQVSAWLYILEFVFTIIRL